MTGTADPVETLQRTFRLPDLGEGLTDAEIVAWRVEDGDQVDVDDVVVDVETAKATVELPCPYAGTVTRRHADVGDVVAVGAALVSIVDEPADSGAVLVGYGTGRATRPPRSRAPRTSSTPRIPASDEAPRVISPLVRRLARDRGVDVGTVGGTGPAGIIVRRDVESAVPAASPEAAHAPAAHVPEARREPLRGVRRAVADKLSRSRREIPDATTWVDVDATALFEALHTLRTPAGDSRISLLALLGRIVVAGLARFPDLNSSVESDGDDLVIVRHTSVHLGVAAQTDRGLMVPVVRGADTMTTSEFAHELNRLTALAREGSLSPEQLSGGTFTLNNYGVFGVDGSTPIINHPEAALLGVGRFTDRPWVVDGELTVRKVGQLSLTFDHRVCDGGVAGGFLRYVTDRVESPIGLLTEL